MPKPEIEFTPSSSFAEIITPGLSTRVLAADRETGDQTPLMARQVQAIRHGIGR